MATIYYAIISTPNTLGRLTNLSQTPATLEAYSINPTDGTASALAGAVSWSNLYTGCYMVKVTDASDGLSVVFRILVHADDQAGVADVAALHGREIEANLISVLEDTGTTLPAQLNTIRGADSDTLETLSDQMDGIATWTAANISSSITAGTITQIRGNSWSIPITSLTLYATKQQFTVKRAKTDSDADALLFIDSVTGLIRVNGSTTGITATDASIVYAGTTLTVTVKANITAQLESYPWVYGIQSIHSDGTVSEVYGGTFTVASDAVRATA